MSEQKVPTLQEKAVDILSRFRGGAKEGKIASIVVVSLDTNGNVSLEYSAAEQHRLSLIGGVKLANRIMEDDLLKALSAQTQAAHEAAARAKAAEPQKEG